METHLGGVIVMDFCKGQITFKKFKYHYIITVGSASEKFGSRV